MEKVKCSPIPYIKELGNPEKKMESEDKKITELMDKLEIEFDLAPTQHAVLTEELYTIKESGKKEAIELLKSFINYANKENKDNHLWYKMQLNNLLKKIQEKE
jgi:hypothetical protein